MGEAPSVALHDLQNESSLDPKNGEIAITIGVKKYFIGRARNEGESLEVRIYDNSTGQWVHPVVLGSKPNSCEVHSAVALGEDRVIIIVKGLGSRGRIWFLEVDSNYVQAQKKLRGGSAVVAWSKGRLGSAEKPIVISGPSGVGKGTLISNLMEEFPYLFGSSVSHTTRAPRNMEKDGLHYYFTDKSDMERDIEDGKFLEYASVHENLYGTSIEAVEVVADEGKVQDRSGQVPLMPSSSLSVHLQWRSLRRGFVQGIGSEIISASLLTTSVLIVNYLSKGTETEEHISKHLQNAEEELQQGVSSGLFYHILYNDNLEECYSRLKKILGLDGNLAKAPEHDFSAIELASHHTTVSKRHDKIIMECETEAENLIVLDVSALKGGAPGRTRGIQEYKIDSYSLKRDCGRLRQDLLSWQIAGNDI